jgi:Tfp pilus assembly protein PilN
MSTDINLLLRTDEESLKQKKRIKILNFIAIGSLIGVGLISLGIFILIQIVNPASVKKEQQNVLIKISQLQDRQSKLFVLNNRIENIGNILKIRRNISKTMSELLTKIPADVSVSSFIIDDKSVTVRGESKSLSPIAELISNLSDMVYKKEIIKSLTLNSLALNTSGNAFEVTIKSDL